MPERRKFPRLPLMFYARIFDRKSGKRLGYLADITPEGIMVIGDEFHPVGKDFSLQLELPEGFSFSEPYIKFEARSIWSQPDLDPSLWNTGFRLSDISASELAIIEQIIHSYSIRSH